MKILAAILMLCLPMKAMGETYICETEQNTFVKKSGIEPLPESLTSYVLDIDRGFRELTGGFDYRGSCQKSARDDRGGSALICTNRNVALANFEQIVMTLEDLTFTRSYHSWALQGHWVASQLGQCVEL